MTDISLTFFSLIVRLRALDRSIFSDHRVMFIDAIMTSNTLLGCLASSVKS